MKNKMFNKKYIIVLVVILLVASLGIAYAYYSAVFNGSETGTTITSTTGILNINFSGGSTITASNISPSDDAFITKTFTVTGTNTTNLIMAYTLTLVIDSNTLSDDAITYSLSSTNTSSNGSVVPMINDRLGIVSASSNYTLGDGYFSNGTSSVHTYILSLYFMDTGSDQSDDQNQTFTAHIKIDGNSYGVPDGWNEAEEGTLLSAIKEDNTVSTPLTIPGREASLINESVLAATTDDYGTSYYYRGNVSNNYVLYANMCWRIVRVTGSGQVKLILYNYNPNSVTNPCDSSANGTSYAFAKYNGTTFNLAFSTVYNDNAYEGFMFGDLHDFVDQEGTTLNSLTFNSTTTYYFADAYAYDYDTNGYYLSGNIISGLWSEVGDSVVSDYPYTCYSTSSSGTCDFLYEMKVNSSTSYGRYYSIRKASTSYSTAFANVNKSTILTNLETWYTNNLSSYSSDLADVIWCNDKSINPSWGTALGYNNYQTQYNANLRIYAKGYASQGATPTLVCNDDEDGGSLSRYTVSDTTYGNGDLYYPIGLLTADELAYAGGAYDMDNISYYLYQNANSVWWTMSPANNVYGWPGMLIGDNYSSISSQFNLESAALRPAIALKSTTQVTGSGTSADPYKVQ